MQTSNGAEFSCHIASVAFCWERVVLGVLKPFCFFLNYLDALDKCKGRDYDVGRNRWNCLKITRWATMCLRNNVSAKLSCAPTVFNIASLFSSVFVHSRPLRLVFSQTNELGFARIAVCEMAMSISLSFRFNTTT